MSYADREDLHRAPGDDAPPSKATPMDMWVGLRIRLRRLELGYSQEWLADRMNVNRNQIYKWERSVHRLVASRLWELANLLKTKPGWFFEGGDPKDLPIADDGDFLELADALTAEAIDVFKKLNALTREQKGQMMAILDAFTRINAMDRANG